MTNLTFTSGDSAELFFGVVLIIVGMLWLIARHATNVVQQYQRVTALTQRARHAIEQQRAAREGCAHPAWKVERLAYAGEGQALKVSCFRCGAPALDRFESRALADGTISIVNATSDVQLLVIEGVAHELLPPEACGSYEDDAHESEYAVYLQPPARD